MKKKKKSKKKKNFLDNFKAFFIRRDSKSTTEVIDDEESNVREVIVEKNSGFNTLEVTIIIIVSVLFGLAAGYALCSTKPVGTIVSEEVQEIIETYESIVENYYGDVDESELLDAAVSGMINTLDDPYSLFMDSDDAFEFNETVDGSFVGIGVTVEWCDGKFRIIEVIDGSPAEKEKLQVDDYIISIDGTSVEGITLDELSSLIRGKKGTEVTLVLLRGEDNVTVTVSRDKVDILSVYSRVINQTNIGIIQITSFASNTAEQFEKQLKKLEKKEIESLIIDVRGNPGGRLGEARNILDLFLGKNKVLYKIETKSKIEKVYTEDSVKREYPVVVLVDSGSASASEILAASFQDNYKGATIVGTVTYGKGTIQKAVKLSSGSTIKYTTQKWLTPKGVWINEVGLTPDVVIEQGEAYYSSISEDDDLQLRKAIEILKK